MAFPPGSTSAAVSRPQMVNPNRSSTALLATLSSAVWAT
jgi:hypothetical protein